jgi:hypothetical protein
MTRRHLFASLIALVVAPFVRRLRPSVNDIFTWRDCDDATRGTDVPADVIKPPLVCDYIHVGSGKWWPLYDSNEHARECFDQLKELNRRLTEFIESEKIVPLQNGDAYVIKASTGLHPCQLIHSSWEKATKA